MKCNEKSLLIIPDAQEEEEEEEELVQLLVQFDHSPHGPQVPLTAGN